MYIYSIDLGAYTTGNTETKFSFNEKLSPAELQEYMKKAAKSAMEYAIANPEEFSWNQHEGIIFGNLYEMILEDLEDLGFEPYTEPIQGRWHGAELSSLCLETPSNKEDTEVQLLREYIPKELRQKALELGKQRDPLLITEEDKS